MAPSIPQQIPPSWPVRFGNNQVSVVLVYWGRICTASPLARLLKACCFPPNILADNHGYPPVLHWISSGGPKKFSNLNPATIGWILSSPKQQCFLPSLSPALTHLSGTRALYVLTMEKKTPACSPKRKAAAALMNWGLLNFKTHFHQSQANHNSWFCWTQSLPLSALL